MIGDLCKKHDCIAVMDEVYEWIFYEGTQHIRMGMLNVFYSNFIILLLLLQQLYLGCGIEP